MKSLFRNRLFILNILFLITGISTASGTELSIFEMRVTPGQTITVPIIIDKVDNLAGMKLSMTYDPKILLFKNGKKTSHTDSLMHIVNDKKPGFLIIVMAGAKGVKGENIPVFSLIFDVNKELEGNHVTRFSITEIQLMSDKLEEIKCDINIQTIIIAAETPSGPISGDKKPAEK